MEFLPIGSVVTIAEGGRPVMIYGRKQTQKEYEDLWDYVACLYPEGNIGEEYNVFFNDEDIEDILFVGFKTNIDRQMQDILNRI